MRLEWYSNTNQVSSVLLYIFTYIKLIGEFNYIQVGPFSFRMWVLINQIKNMRISKFVIRRLSFLLSHVRTKRQSAPELYSISNRKYVLYTAEWLGSYRHGSLKSLCRLFFLWHCIYVYYSVAVLFMFSSSKLWVFMVIVLPTE